LTANLNKRVLSDSVVTLAASVVGQVTSVVRGILIPLILGPISFGFWRVLLVIYQYGLFLHLGTFAYLNREMPGLEATGELQEAQRVRRACFWGTMSVALVAAILIGAASLLWEAPEVPWASWGLVLCGFALFTQQIVVFQQVVLRARAQFGRLALVSSLMALLSLGLIIGLGTSFDAAGMMLALGLSSLVASLVMLRWVRIPRPVFNWPTFGGFILKGAPLSALPILFVALTTTGQLVSVWLFGLEATGHYGIGASFGSIIYAVPNAISLVLYPHFLSSIAKTQDPGEVGRLMRHGLGVSAVTSPAAACCGIVLLDPLYRFAFPDYLPGLTTGYVLLATMGILAHIQLVQSAILAIRRHWTLIVIQSSALAVGVLLSILLGSSMGAIEGVAIAFLIAGVGATITATWLALDWTRSASASRKDDAFSMTSLTGPSVILAITALATMYLIPPSPEYVSAVQGALARLALVALVALGLFVPQLRRLKLHEGGGS
jgi:O-antigen/teichoic acid export membrane protein